MTHTPTNYWSMKIIIPLLRAGAIRWYEAINSGFQAALHVLAGQVRRVNYRELPASTTLYAGRLASPDTTLGNLDFMQPTNSGDPNQNVPFTILDVPSTEPGATALEWFGKMIGRVNFPAAHGITPGSVGYLSATPGLITTTGSVVVGIYLPDKGFLFMPHNT